MTHDPALVHDLAVQAAVLRRLLSMTRSSGSPRSFSLSPSRSPDVLLRSPQGAWVALDYERQRKDDSRIYITFRNHAEAIMNQHYRGVHLLFDRADLERYRTLFDAEAWPEYDFHRKKGRSPRSPPPLSRTPFQLRQCFVFILEDADTPAPSGAGDPQATDPAPHERQSTDGDEDQDSSQAS